MRCLKYTLPRKTLERLFIKRIRPIIEYADVIYDNCPKYLADRLEGLQMEAAQICTSLRTASIWHTRLRLGMSQLSAHLSPFDIVVSSRCSCGVTHETVPHYLLDCPLYAAQRERLLVAIINIIAPTLHPATLPILDKDAYIKILLFGSKDLSSEENILLFRATQNFILNSDRFSQHNNIL